MRAFWIALIALTFVVTTNAQDATTYFDAENFQFGLDRALFADQLMDADLAEYPAGIRRLIASAPVANIPEGSLLEIQWFYNGQPETETEPFVYTGASKIVTSLSNTDGLASGIYTYQIRFDNITFERSITLVETPFIYPFRFGQDCTAYTSEVLGFPKERYLPTDVNIAMQVRFANFLPETGVRWQVLRNGEPLTANVERNYTGSGYYCYNYFNVSEGLGTALYEFLLIDMQSGVEIHREALVVAGG